MIKRNLPMLLITSVVILIPVLIGFLLWNQLPEQIPMHWNIQGEVDSYGSKLVSVLIMPLFLVALHWICTLLTCADPKNKDIEGKPLTLVLWICPVISLMLSTIIYITAMGHSISVEVIVPLIMGLLFVVIGNYMPKCKHNYSIGVKTPWTLNDEENWYKTHRFAGILWVAGGVLIMATSFLGIIWLFMIVLVPMAFAPMIYSYCIYRKKNC